MKQVSGNSDNTGGLVSGIAGFIRQSSGVEAVRLQSDGRHVALATLGKVDREALERDLQRLLVRINAVADSTAMASCGQDVGAGLKMRSVAGGVQLERPSCPTAPAFWIWREVPWPEAAATDSIAGDTGHSAADHDDWKIQALLAAGCGLLGLGAFIYEGIAGGRDFTSIMLYVLAMVAGGWDAAGDAFAKVRRGRLDIHFLMLAVAVGAGCIGAWGEGALLLFLFSTAGALEHYAMDRTRREIVSLFKVAPKEALVLDEAGREQVLAVDQVAPGMKLRVKPGSLFPVDVRIVRGETAVDESNLTGESVPVDKKAGATAMGGTMNLWGAVEAEVLRPAAESSLQKVIRLIQEARHLKAPSQRFTDRFGTGYTWLVLGLTSGMFLFWWQFMGIPAVENGDWGFSAFYRAMTLLVVASPCALVISIPSAILSAIAWGARRGVLFRGGAAVEKLAEVDTVALDKTGTLTTGDLSVYSVETFPAGNEDAILRVAAALESHANHPIARAIVAHAAARGLIGTADVSAFVAITGTGVKGQVDGCPVYLGRRDILSHEDTVRGLNEIPLPSAGFTEVWVVLPDKVGRILLFDQVREASAGVLQALRGEGLALLMLTGDRPGAAAEVANAVGLSADEIRAEMTPEGKVDVLATLTREGRRLAMIGDGVNDAPCLAAAYVSVAMGARGSDAALEQSEVVLMRDRIERFYDAYCLSRRARGVIRQNLVIALGTVVLMVGMALTGWLPLSVGVLAHEGSTVLVCLNSLRLLFTPVATEGLPHKPQPGAGRNQDRAVCPEFNNGTSERNS